MNTFVKLYSIEENEIERFLKNFSGLDEINLENPLEWIKQYKNPVEMSELIGIFIDNRENYNMNMWISIDEGYLINVTDHNANSIIKYLYERYPY